MVISFEWALSAKNPWAHTDWAEACYPPPPPPLLPPITPVKENTVISSVFPVNQAI